MYIIIGSGPTGLSLAWYLSKLNKDVIIIEREAEIGGCHRVRRVNGLFTEHGPRIYLNNYINFINILKDMDLNFHDLFVKYEYPTLNLVRQSIKNFSFKNIITFMISYFNFLLNPNAYLSMTMLEYVNKHKFSNEAKDYIDRFCRLTDGAGSDRYTVYEFFQIINQNIFYNIYQPKLPNDKGLFKFWYEKLIQNNVKIFLNTQVISLNQDSITIYNDKTNKTKTLQAEKYIFAIPPKSFIKILDNSPQMKNIYGPYNQLSQWASATNYLTYIPITVHWNQKLKLPKIWGFPSSEWGIAFIILSDYMHFDESKTVISSCITKSDIKSSFINKTANECDAQTLIEETYRQLKNILKDLPLPTNSLLSPEMKYDGTKWETIDNAFILTPLGYLNKYNYENRIYQVGTQNGKSHYSFTSMESAITNALYLLKEIEPKMNIKIEEGYTLNKFLILFFISRIIIFIIIFYLYSNFS